MDFDLPHRVQILGTLPILFLRWYLLEMPKRITKTYGAYAHAFAEMFSFSFMLQTIFDPWKGITEEYDIRTLNWELIAQTFFLNLTTRMIGFLFRIVAICIGLIVQIVALVAGIACLIVWLLYPILVIVALRFVLSA